jgi:hypothetical protein
MMVLKRKMSAVCVLTFVYYPLTRLSPSSKRSPSLLEGSMGGSWFRLSCVESVLHKEYGSWPV